MPALGNGMLIRVALPNKEEGLFNADCTVALLLDTIKKRHQIARQETIDLCSVDGTLKQLSSHLNDNGGGLFELRGLHIVVKVIPSENTHSVTDSESLMTVSSPTYVPVLDEYSKDEDFMAALNTNIDGQHSSARVKKRSGHPSGHKASHALKPPTPDGGKSKSGKSKRRASIMK